MSSPFVSLFVDLAASQSSTSVTLPDSDEIWFRANDRFDVCARWMHDEQSVQLLTYVRMPADGLAPLTDAPPDDEDSGWIVSDTQTDDWTYLMAWHEPSSCVAALCRGPVRTLDATRFPVFVQSFLDHVLALDRVFNPGSQDHAQ